MKLAEFFGLMQRVKAAPMRLSAEDQVIVNLMQSYFAEMYAIERDDEGQSHRSESDESMLKRLEASIQRQKEVHSRYWCNTSLFYEPCSTTTDPEHDWKRITNFKVLRNGDENGPLFLFLFAYMNIHVNEPRLHCYGLRTVGGKPMIEHQYH